MDKTLTFSKYQGAGIDFVMVNNIADKYTFLTDNTDLIGQLCDRKFGIGGDGLIELQKDQDCHFYMKYYNADGKVSTMCGNGARCAVLFAKLEHIITRQCTFKACDGVHSAQIVDKPHDEGGYIVRVHMVNVNEVVPINNVDYFVNTGSPHYVRFVESLAEHDVETEGRTVRYSKAYKDIGGVNVNFVEVEASGRALKVRTFERGVEAETLACGTGAVASALAHLYSSLKEERDGKDEDGINKASSSSGSESRHVTSQVTMPGGKMSVDFTVDINNRFTDIWLCGPAKQVFTGQIVLSL